MIDLARVHGMDDRPGAQEQERLEKGMVPHVEQGPAQTEHNPISSTQGAPEHGQAHTHDDDANVLNAVVSEQALQVMLADGEGDAQHARSHSQSQQ